MAFSQDEHLSSLTGIGRGIEREGLRVLSEGRLSLKPHYKSLGSALKALGRLEESKASYIKSINLEPKNSNHYMLLGRVLRELGEHDESVKNYKKSIFNK